MGYNGSADADIDIFGKDGFPVSFEGQCFREFDWKVF
jgi:hypothetical protein